MNSKSDGELCGNLSLSFRLMQTIHNSLQLSTIEKGRHTHTQAFNSMLVCPCTGKCSKLHRGSWADCSDRSDPFCPSLQRSEQNLRGFGLIIQTCAHTPPCAGQSQASGVHIQTDAPMERNAHKSADTAPENTEYRRLSTRRTLSGVLIFMQYLERVSCGSQ